MLFAESRAKWAAVAMVAAMFTLPVAGTALNIADQHLHPRNLATALILVAVSRILEGKRWQAVPLLMLAFALHPIMATLGISFCIFEALALTAQAAPLPMRIAESTLAAAMPLSWILEPASPAWRQALNTKSYYFLFHWTWYEWLGALAPLFLFWVLSRVALRHGQTRLSRFALAVVAYGVFQQIVAMAITADALSSTRLHFHGAGGGRVAGPLSAKGSSLALGGLPAGFQRQHVPGAMGVD